MPCTSKIIPEYLHTNGRAALPKEFFSNEHKIYRVTKHPANPVEFPTTITALSCKWSFIIKEEDILISNDPPVGEGYKYALVGHIKNYCTKSEILLGNYIGWHKLTCVLLHTPNDCDYSHCEILIKHDFFNNETENELVESWVYTHKAWEGGKTVLQKNSCKKLKNDYRRDLIALFYLPEIEANS